ncbi:MAG: hypothetical protein JWM89_19 [Acidimicrobiales bacterium]|nr:hypothetical protein [Acidimicrobiales bacterium]
MSDQTPPRPGNEAPAAPAAQTPSTVRAVVAAASGTTINPLDRSSYAVATNRGYGEAMGRGLELALTLLVMVGLGLLVDHLAGTSPLFVIVFSVLGFAGISVKLYLGYDLEMRKHDDGAVWSRSSDGSGNHDPAGNGPATGAPGTMAS